ncbi:MAG: hypothetical protein M3Z08_23860, partial [Chloroflexota bacterium]|nr:hypothetical protein [Chloroflexota bacterium]
MLRNRIMCSGDPGGRHDGDRHDGRFHDGGRQGLHHGIGAPVHNRAISLGIFTYLNVQPVYYGMLHEGARPDVRLVTGVPTRLNRALLSGEVDLSSVSGYAYAEHASELRLIPHLS